MKRVLDSNNDLLDCKNDTESVDHIDKKLKVESESIRFIFSADSINQYQRRTKVEKCEYSINKDFILPDRFYEYLERTFKIEREENQTGDILVKDKEPPCSDTDDDDEDHGDEVSKDFKLKALSLQEFIEVYNWYDQYNDSDFIRFVSVILFNSYHSTKYPNMVDEIGYLRFIIKIIFDRDINIRNQYQKSHPYLLPDLLKPDIFIEILSNQIFNDLKLKEYCSRNLDLIKSIDRRVFFNYYPILILLTKILSTPENNNNNNGNILDQILANSTHPNLNRIKNNNILDQVLANTTYRPDLHWTLQRKNLFKSKEPNTPGESNNVAGPPPLKRSNPYFNSDNDKDLSFRQSLSTCNSSMTEHLIIKIIKDLLNLTDFEGYLSKTISEEPSKWREDDKYPEYPWSNILSISLVSKQFFKLTSKLLNQMEINFFSWCKQPRFQLDNPYCLINEPPFFFKYNDMRSILSYGNIKFTERMLSRVESLRIHSDEYDTDRDDEMTQVFGSTYLNELLSDDDQSYRESIEDSSYLVYPPTIPNLKKLTITGYFGYSKNYSDLIHHILSTIEENQLEYFEIDIDGDWNEWDYPIGSDGEHNGSLLKLLDNHSKSLKTIKIQWNCQTLSFFEWIKYFADNEIYNQTELIFTDLNNNSLDYLKYPHNRMEIGYSFPDIDYTDSSAIHSFNGGRLFNILEGETYHFFIST